MRGHESAAGGQQKEEHLQLPKGQVSDTLNRHPEARKARGDPTRTKYIGKAQ